MPVFSTKIYYFCLELLDNLLDMTFSKGIARKTGTVTSHELVVDVCNHDY